MEKPSKVLEVIRQVITDQENQLEKLRQDYLKTKDPKLMSKIELVAMSLSKNKQQVQKLETKWQEPPKPLSKTEFRIKR